MDRRSPPAPTRDDDALAPGIGGSAPLLREHDRRTPAWQELERAKNAAESANEAKTRYLVSASHEFRSPLNAIYGYAQLLELDGASAKEAGTIIRRSAEHLAGLVDGLLEISRIESGVLKLRSDVVDIRAMLEHVVGMFHMQAVAKGLDFTLDIQDRLPERVKTDESRLRQILINLVSNAVKYTQEGGIAITVRYRSQVMDLAVRDTGIGIAPQDLDRIFEPFDRGSLPEAQLQPGIGLGLAITRMLASLLGGDITASSVVGESSTFRLRVMLPVVAEPLVNAARGDRIIGYEGRPRTILVVDDDPTQRAILQSLLRPLGFVVHVTANGQDGIACADQHPPDLALIDVQMPGLSGWETASRLRSLRGRAIRIIMVSASATECPAAGDAIGSDDAVIAKPVDLHQLLASICHLLDLRWQYAGRATADDHAGLPKPPPEEVRRFVGRLRQLAEIGHLRGVRSALDDLAKQVPAAAHLVTDLRRHLNNVDLRALTEALDSAELE